jgi:hypothetical protein
MRNELTERAREALEVPWDDLRHRRVLMRTLEELRAKPARRSPVRWLVATGLAVAVVILVLFAIPRREHSPEVVESEPAPEVAVVAPPVAPIVPVDEASLVLVDGSIVRLGPGARVETEHESLATIELRQSAGLVHYTVPPVEGREFTLRVATIMVVVAAAAFDVEVGVDVVTFRIERGSIEVITGDRRVQLGAGERATLRAGSETAAAKHTAPTRHGDAPTPQRPSADELLQRADEARNSGRFDAAVDALESMLRFHPRDPRIPVVLFTLGKVERSRGRHSDAAHAFESCWKKRKHGPLAGDALGSAALEFQRAGTHMRAAELARLYIAKFPAGLHAAEMYEILR